MLVVYLATLNHWISLINLVPVATVAGWRWEPQVTNPLMFLATLPFRFLPPAQIPTALNAFSALCAAAALGVLARSVAILPHDRTDMERARERSDFSFLTNWAAWIPPLAAVIFAGLQLAFWEHATSFSGESLNLLLFAVVIWQLLEYRLDEREGRILLAAFLYGLGITENWALLGFAPLFLMMIIWLRKLDFFNAGFFINLVLAGFAGLLLMLLLPALSAFNPLVPVTFWDALRVNLRTDWQVIHLVARQDLRHALGLIALTSLLPAFIAALRWSSGFGDSSRTGIMLVNYTMHTVNAAIFAVLVWVTFDPPFSAGKLLQSAGFSMPALTFNYIGALCIGYFSGYALLIFGTSPPSTKRNSRPDPALPAGLMWLSPVIVTGTLAGIVVAAGLLVDKNSPLIQSINDDSLRKFGQRTIENLPAEGAILLSDNDGVYQGQPVRAYLVQAALAAAGKTQRYPVVDTQSLTWPSYHDYLHSRFPAAWPASGATNRLMGMSPLNILVRLHDLSQSNQLYYLNPSFGYYFEEFYQIPHGLNYALKLLPEENLLPPPLDASLGVENEAFWEKTLEDCRQTVARANKPRNMRAEPGILGWVARHLHIPLESNPNALLAGEYYSQSLDALGVQEQRAGRLKPAHDQFSAAAELNTNNVAATVNLAFNEALQAGAKNVVDLSEVTPDRFGKYRSWNEVLGANGPFDETSFCFEYGQWLVGASLPRQATAQFARVRQLAPDNLAARLFLGQIYLLSRKPALALEALADPLEHPAKFALTSDNSTELDVLASAAHFQKNENAEGAALLEQEIARHPSDQTLLLASAQSFIMRGLYTNALDAIDRKLALTPDDSQWLYGKGLVELQLGKFDDATATLNRFLELNTNNPDALFNRGFAYFKAGRLAAAKADFSALQATHTNNFQVAYGLAEIAWQQHDTNEALRNYRIYLANASTNFAEYKSVQERVSQASGK